MEKGGAAMTLKNHCKRIVRFLWRKTGPARQPLVRRAQAFILRSVGPLDEHLSGRLDAVENSLARIEHALNLMNLAADRRTEEVHVMFRGIVQEIVRLDEQLEMRAEEVRAPLVFPARQMDARLDSAA
jgi:hypothetical protein